MPLLLLKLRWLWVRRDQVGWGIAAILALLLYVACVKINAQKNAYVALQAARPEIDWQKEVDEVVAPSVTKTKITRYLPAQPCTDSGITYREGNVPYEVIENEIISEGYRRHANTERHEEPAPLPKASKPLYAGLEYAPISKHTAARFSFTFDEWLELSARHELPFAGELHFEPWVGVGVRF
jgi:hypothetical protein